MHYQEDHASWSEIFNENCCHHKILGRVFATWIRNVMSNRNTKYTVLMTNAHVYVPGQVFPIWTGTLTCNVIDFRDNVQGRDFSTWTGSLAFKPTRDDVPGQVLLDLSKNVSRLSIARTHDLSTCSIF